MTVVFSAAAQAETQNPTSIVVGSELDYPPYALVDKNGRADGFSVDLMKAVCRVMNLDCRFRVGPWSEVRKALEDGEIDALPLVSYSDERERVFDFTTPHTMAYGTVFVRKNSSWVKSEEALRGHRIAVMRADATHDYLKRKGFDEKDLVLTRTVADALRLVADDKVDYAVAPRLVGLLTAQEQGLDDIKAAGPLLIIDSYGRGYGFAVREGNRKLLALLNQGLAVVKNSGEYDEIYEKWFGIVDPPGVGPEAIGRYLVIGSAAFMAVVFLFSAWTFMLRRQVDQRTAELTREVAERKRTEAALRQKTEELERSNADLQQFAYAVSHDLREPLRMVSSYLQLVERRYTNKLDQDGREFMDFAVKGAQRMAVMISDLVEYSRVRTHGEVFRTVETHDLVREALSNLSVAIEEQDAKVVVNPDLPAVTGDPAQLTRVFQNLIGNAIKYRAPDRPAEVTVGAGQRDGTPVLFVRDNGIGIDPEHFERIFAVFQRLHGRDEYDGTGVGLAVVKRIVERHGGRIWVESTPGEGSTFLLTLPNGATA